MAAPTLSSFLNSIYSYVKSAAPQINVSPGTVFAQIMDAVATMLYQTSNRLTAAQTNAFLSTAQGIALDALGNDHGLTRTSSAFASGTVQFTRSTATSFQTIPAGTIVSTNNFDPTTNIFFVTTQIANFAAGQLTTSASVVASTPGAVGNVNVGTVTILQSAIQNISSVINNSAMTGGVDEESDDQFRFRIYASLSPQNTLTQIQNAVLAVAGVGTAVAFDQQDLHGNFYVYACETGGSLPAALQTSIQSVMATSKSLGTTGTLYVPTVTPINFSYSYAVFTNFTPATVKAAVDAIIQGYFNDLNIGDPVRPFDIMTRIIGNVPGFPVVPGLENFQISSPSGILTALPWQIYTLNQILGTQISS